MAHTTKALTPKKQPEKTSVIKGAFEALNQAVQALITTEDWKTYLRVQSRFHNYSFNNTLWLIIQAQDRGVNPTRFASFKAWSAIKRHVRKGEQGFKILAPVLVQSEQAEGTDEKAAVLHRGFRVVYVFDISQTEGEPLPTVTSQLMEESDQALDSFRSLKEWLTQTLKVKVERRPLPGSTNGFSDSLTQTVVVRDDLSSVHALKTLIHETAHCLLHNEDHDVHHRPVNEVEAESVAFVVMAALGFGSGAYSFGYVAAWSGGDPDVVRKTGARVQRTAKTILEVLGVQNLHGFLSQLMDCGSVVVQVILPVPNNGGLGHPVQVYFGVRVPSVRDVGCRREDSAFSSEDPRVLPCVILCQVYQPFELTGQPPCKSRSTVADRDRNGSDMGRPLVSVSSDVPEVVADLHPDQLGVAAGCEDCSQGPVCCVEETTSHGLIMIAQQLGVEPILEQKMGFECCCAIVNRAHVHQGIPDGGHDHGSVDPFPLVVGIPSSDRNPPDQPIQALKDSPFLGNHQLGVQSRERGPG